MEGTYEGQYHVNGQRDGVGTCTFANGSHYEGQWKADEYHGDGQYMAANGDGYEGEFKAGVMHGDGTFWFVNGDKYVGAYKNGVMDGHGSFTEASTGECYEGEWKVPDSMASNGPTPALPYACLAPPR